MPSGINVEPDRRTIFDAHTWKVTQCTGYPAKCDDCENNPCNFKETNDQVKK